MSLEVHRFPIPPEVTEAVLDEADSFDETLEYAKGVLAKARTKHPAMYGYLAYTAKEQGDFWYSYGIASALSYDIVTRQLEARGLEIDITEQDLETHKVIADHVFNDPRWQDETWVLERAATKDREQADSGLGLFFNVLDSSAPEFASAIADFTNRIELPVNRRHTLRGFYDGFMPFYTKSLRVAEG